VANAEGGSASIAPNTWVAIHGANLAPVGDSRAWQTSDFINGQMPSKRDGVSATVNGKAAFVYYISPTQINILTPPCLLKSSCGCLPKGRFAMTPFPVLPLWMDTSLSLMNFHRVRIPTEGKTCVTLSTFPCRVSWISGWAKLS
jgi:hypothetical protein